MKRVWKYIGHFLFAKRKGHDVHSPFIFELCEEVFYNQHSFYDFEKLKRIRSELSKSDVVLKVEDLGAGSKKFRSAGRKVSDIIKFGISTGKQAELIYRLVNFLRPVNCIEMGTSIGLTTMYMCLANTENRVYTLEGSVALGEFASALWKRNKIDNCKMIKGNFDDTLPELLNEIKELGLVYIDGNHTYSATKRYFDEFAKRSNNNTVVILDDIYWSEEMTKAWEEIKSNPKVTCTLDLFDLGIVFFRKEFKEKINLKLFV